MASSSNGNVPLLVQSPPKGYAPLNHDGIQLANLAAWHLARIGNTGILAAPPEPSSTQAIGSIPNPAATQKRVWLDEPPGSIPFDEQGSVFLPILTAGEDITVVEFQVPVGLDGVIKWISNNVINNLDPFLPGQLIWRILINNRSVRNFGMITLERGSVAQGRQVSPIRLFAGDVVRYTVQSPAAGVPPVDGQTVCSLTGYYFPAKGVS